MARMKKNEPGHEAAANRWRESMLKKLGSEEALHKHMQGMGRKGGMNGVRGGFAANPALAKIAGRKGGKAHAGRGKDSDYNYEAIWAEHGAEITAKYESRTHSVQELADEYGISTSSLRYRIRRDVPEEPKKHYEILAMGAVMEREDAEDEIFRNQGQREIGNYFSSREEAELAVRKLKAFKRLKDKGFRFTGWEDLGAKLDMDDLMVFNREVIDTNNVIGFRIDDYRDCIKDLDTCFGGEE